MSEFICRNGHLMKPSDGVYCRKCGAKVRWMDGESDREIAGRERWGRKHSGGEEREDEEDER